MTSMTIVEAFNNISYDQLRQSVASLPRESTEADESEGNKVEKKKD